MKQARISSDCGCGQRGEEPVTHQLQRVERLHHRSGLDVAILGLDSDAAQALAGEAQRLQQAVEQSSLARDGDVYQSRYTHI